MQELLIWLFPVAVSLHNLKEGLGFTRHARFFSPRHEVDVGAFRFALVTLALLAFLSAWVSTLGGARSLGAYLHAGYMLAMLLNVFIPHLMLSLLQRRLMPGTVTGVLLIAPITLVGLYLGLSSGTLEPVSFILYGVGVTLVLLTSLPLLFRLGGLLFGKAI